jgi:hypothetical protein
LVIPDPDADFLPSRIPGSKRHPIPDPDPQHCILTNKISELWIRIRIDKQTWFPAFQKGFCIFVGKFLDHLFTKNSTSCDFQSLIRIWVDLHIGFDPWPQIRIEIKSWKSKKIHFEK